MIINILNNEIEVKQNLKIIKIYLDEIVNIEI